MLIREFFPDFKSDNSETNMEIQENKLMLEIIKFNKYYSLANLNERLSIRTINFHFIS